MKIYIPHIILVFIIYPLITNLSFAQEIIFNDNFDSYQAGEQLACQNPTEWTTTNNSPCDFLTDPVISNGCSFSGNNSVLTVLNNDAVKPLPDYNSGVYKISFYNYVPETKSGYFNTLSHFEGNLSNWGMEVYFNFAGLWTGTVNAGGYNTATFYIVYDQWVLNEVIVNLDADSGKYFYNGLLVCEWQWSLGFNGNGVPKILAGSNFWGGQWTDSMFVDDYKVEELFIPVELTSFTAEYKNDQVLLQWGTATETNNRGFEVQRAKGGDQRSEGRGQRSEWEEIGFVEGNGTTTLRHQYSFKDENLQPGKYIYRLKQIDFDGSFEYSYEIEADVRPALKYSLEQNFPNPFNSTTTVCFSLPEAAHVAFNIYNTMGQKVVEVVNATLEKGGHCYDFNAKDFASGMYILDLRTNKFASNKKMVLLK